MNIEETEQAIRELDAVKNFAEQKEQLERALREIGELAEELKNCSTKLEDEKTRSEALQKERERCDEVTKAQQKELKNERQKTSDLTAKLEDLHNLRSIWEGKTLIEVIAFEQKAREDEITRRSKEQLGVIRDAWEKDEKPIQVQDAAMSALRRILDDFDAPGPHHFADGGPEGELAKTVAKLLGSKIKAKAETDFLSKGKELAERMTRDMFDQRKKGVWSRYAEERLGPNLRELQAQIIISFAKFIEGEFIVSCDNCETANALRLTSDGVVEIIRRGSTLVPCANEACRDMFGRHNIRVSLRDLVKARLHLADEPPA